MRWPSFDTFVSSIRIRDTSIRGARCLSVPDMLSWPMLVSSSQIGVVEKLKERGKEISNDSVAEKMLDL